jgi:hypothetical protein
VNTETTETSPAAVPEGGGEHIRRTGLSRSPLRTVACALAVVALVAALASPAAATAGGAQRFTVVFAGPDGQAGRVVATGVFNGLGSNPASVGDQELIFPAGTLLLSTEFTGGSGSFDPLSCIGRGSSTGTFVVTGGSGQFAHASGSGTFTGSGVTIARRLGGGGCSETEVNRYSVVSITGSIALAT